MNNKFNTSKTFQASIDTITRNSDVSYFDAVIEYATKNNVEIETVASFIRRNPTMKARLEEECHNLNLLVNTTSTVTTIKEKDENGKNY